MAQNKTFYYLEIKITGSSGEILGQNLALRDQHIAETDNKYSKVAKDTVFSSVYVHETVGDTQAVTLEFSNSRQYDTYITASTPFREWAIANHNVEYVYEKTSTAAYGALAKNTSNTEDGTRTYYDDMEDYMVRTLPRERGFLTEE